MERADQEQEAAAALTSMLLPAPSPPEAAPPPADAALAGANSCPSTAVQRPSPASSTPLIAGLQTSFSVGASVYDGSHKKSRGYGVIASGAGHGRWKVRFAGGQRTTALQESSLHLAHIHNDEREPPSGLQQRIVVVLGPLAGQQGTTQSKAGAAAPAAPAAALQAPHACNPCMALPPTLPAAGWRQVDMPVGQQQGGARLPCRLPARHGSPRR